MEKFAHVVSKTRKTLEAHSLQVRLSVWASSCTPRECGSKNKNASQFRFAKVAGSNPSLAMLVLDIRVVNTGIELGS